MSPGGLAEVRAGSHEARGKTIGIIGYGHIGSQVGVLAEMLGMRVLYHDVTAKLTLGNVEPAGDLDDLLERSDAVTLHVPDAPRDTIGLIGERELRRMRTGAVLINASRGKVVDLEALRGALLDGHLAGSRGGRLPRGAGRARGAVRVPPVGVDSALLTPHIGGSTEEAQAGIGREVAAKLLRYSDDGSTLSAVGFPEVTLPPQRAGARLLHVHENQPGMLGGDQRRDRPGGREHRRAVPSHRGGRRLRRDRRRGLARGGAGAPVRPARDPGDPPQPGPLLMAGTAASDLAFEAPGDEVAREIRGALAEWFHHEQRDLPWRRTRDPYAVWISEAMLQQTRVEVVLDYWPRFIAAFPDVRALARATDEAVLEAWSGLGYYRRARALQAAAARVIDEEHGGVFPTDPEEVLALPGVGPYTAGAVLSIALDLPEPIVDGNVERVFARLFHLDGVRGSGPLMRAAWSAARYFVARDGGGVCRRGSGTRP